MKKIIVILIGLLVFLFSGCAGGSIELNGDDISGVVLPVPPEIGDIPSIEDEEKNKKTYIISNAQGLRIRSGAGANYAVIGNLEKQDALLYTGKVGEYYTTVYKEKTGYVHSAYCSLFTVDTHTGETEKAIDFGMTLLGYPYVWGSERYHWGNGKLNSNFINGQFDCSAFVQYIYYKTSGVLLDVTSRAQSLEGELVSSDGLQRGDLMFFTNASRKDKVGIEKVGHVGIYFGDNYILHTASDHAVLEPISQTRWGYYLHARRVV